VVFAQDDRRAGLPGGARVSCNVIRRHHGLRLTEPDRGAPETDVELRHVSHFRAGARANPIAAHFRFTLATGDDVRGTST
jgi:hypothetical protein